MKPSPNCMLDYNAASFNHLLLKSKMTPCSSQTARHSFRHGTIFFLFFPVAQSSVVPRANPDLTEVFSLPSFPASRATLLSFFSSGDALLVKFLKASFGNFVSHWTVPSSALCFLSLLFLFYFIVQDDAIIGGADTRRPRKITIIPPDRL